MGTQIDTGMDRLRARVEDLKRTRDELRLKAHLLGMEARGDWLRLEPHLDEVERQLAKLGASAAHQIGSSLDKLGEAFKKLGDQLSARG